MSTEPSREIAAVFFVNLLAKMRLIVPRVTAFEPFLESKSNKLFSSNMNSLNSSFFSVNNRMCEPTKKINSPRKHMRLYRESHLVLNRRVGSSTK